MRRPLRTTVAALLIGLTGCDEIPESALLLAPSSLERRQIESRRFEGIKEANLLAASAAVLQDLGFNIDESESKLGVITASKDRTAVDAGQIAGAILLAILLRVDKAVDLEQKIRVSLAVGPVTTGTPDHFFVRVIFQRIVTNTSKIQRAEWIKDPGVYKEFFDKLSQAVFLEAHKI